MTRLRARPTLRHSSHSVILGAKYEERFASLLRERSYFDEPLRYQIELASPGKA